MVITCSNEKVDATELRKDGRKGMKRFKLINCTVEKLFSSGTGNKQVYAILYSDELLKPCTKIK